MVDSTIICFRRAETDRSRVSKLADITQRLDESLPAFAREVIQTHLDLEDSRNQAFLSNPDARDQHKMHWHQWGIITHTRVFLRQFETAVPKYLATWAILAPVDAHLRAEIDNVSRWELLPISILLHDIGKFAARTRGRNSFHFGGHEAFSGQIIRQELGLDRLGLTPLQIEYVARTAEDHFVLGLVRKRAREQGEFDVRFIESERFAALCREIKREHRDDFVEVGVLFLGDSLAKADPDLGPELALSQHSINLEVARRYLELVLANPSL